MFFISLRCNILFLFLISVQSLFAQKLVNVNLLTGTGSISLPLGQVSAGEISYPLGLTYYAGGLKVNDYGEKYGLGWSSTIDAAIVRQVKGFPDDVEYNGGTGYSTIKGWIRSGTISANVEGFNIANDNNASTCSDEVSDYTYMSTYVPDNFDSEPDIFTVNVPGLSFQFIFDKNQNIKITPYVDILIEKTLDGTSGQITSFTVTTDNGAIYKFEKPVLSYVNIPEVITPGTLPAFNRDYYFYRHDIFNSGMGFYSQWNLTSITDIKGNRLVFNYENYSINNQYFLNAESLDVLVYNPSSSVFDKTHLYTRYVRTEVQPRLVQILSEEGGIGTEVAKISYTNGTVTSSLKEIKFLKTGLTSGLEVKGPYNKTNDVNQNGRYFLKSFYLNTTNCSSLTEEWKFKYEDVDFTTGSTYLSGLDSITNAQDYWGYFNNQTGNTSLDPAIWVVPGEVNDKFKMHSMSGYSGSVYSLSGANRTINSSAIKGSLTRIFYPNGGVTDIEYENNDYYDGTYNGIVLGGGLRIKKITDNDGLNNTETYNYIYTDPSTNVSTGKAVTIPEFAFTIPSSASFSSVSDKVNKTTYRTISDNSEDLEQIIYGKVTVQRTNGGKSIYEFNTSGTRWSAASGDWTETINYICRKITSAPTPCGAISPDILTVSKHTLPFAINSNFSYERGLLTKVSNYNESGGLVSEETLTYSSSHSSTTKIWSLKYDDMAGVRAYSLYPLLVYQNNLLATKTSKAYNSTSPGSSYFTSETETLTYPSGSTTYRLPIEISKTNSDGAITKIRMKYVKDYTTSGSGDDMEKAIHSMKAKLRNALIETYTSVTPVGGSEKYISGSITKYKIINDGAIVNIPLPLESYMFSSSGGNSTFTPSSISSGNFTYDGAYYKTGTILKHTDVGNPTSVIGNARITNTTLYSSPPIQYKIADVSNAKFEEVLYTNFEFDGLRYMSYTSSDIFKGGRHSTNCLTLKTTTNISGSITKASTNNYLVFSCWLIKPGKGTGTLTVNLNDGTYSSNYTISFGQSGWKYYEVKMPKPAGSTVTVTVTTNTDVKIDDVLVYPDNAIIKTYSYTSFTALRGSSNVLLGIRMTAETGMNGISKYYEYASNTVPYTIRDVEENILQINEQRAYNQDFGPALFRINKISWATPAQINVPVNIDVMITTPCYATITYTWDFGDGSGSSATSTPFTSHIYTVSGNYTVSCTISASGFTSDSYSSPGNLIVKPGPTPTLCQNGIIDYVSSTSAYTYAYCPPDPLPSNATTFKVIGLDGALLSEATNFRFEKAAVGSGSWSTIYNGTNNYVTVSFSAGTTTSYKVRCIATVSGQTATSGDYTVIVH